MAKEQSWLRQIAIPVVVALLIGSSSPWWWDAFRGHEGGGPSEPTQRSGSDNLDRVPDGDGDVKIATPSADFEGGSRRIFTANLAAWPKASDANGVVEAGFGDSLVLRPASNTWIGSGQQNVVTGLDGDFVIDWNFTIAQRDPSAALEINLAGDGQDAQQITLILDVWDSGNVDYSIGLNVLRSGGNLLVTHVVPVASIAERVQVPETLATADWSNPSTLTLKRVGGALQFFVNGVFVKEFSAPVFTVRSLGVGAAFKSVIEVRSIEARVRP